MIEMGGHQCRNLFAYEMELGIYMLCEDVLFDDKRPGDQPLGMHVVGFQDELSWKRGSYYINA